MSGGESSHEVGSFPTRQIRRGRIGTHCTGTGSIVETFSVLSVNCFIITRTLSTGRPRCGIPFTRKNVGRKE